MSGKRVARLIAQAESHRPTSKHSRLEKGTLGAEAIHFLEVLSSYMTSVETPSAVPAPPDGSEEWSIEKAKALYNVEGWGAGYFDVSERGRVIVRPDRAHPERSLDSLRPNTTCSSGFDPHSSPTPCALPNWTISSTT